MFVINVFCHSYILFRTVMKNSTQLFRSETMKFEMNQENVERSSKPKVQEMELKATKRN